jgi:hypothetical protein
VSLTLIRTEVDALRKDGLVAARTVFPGGRELRYEVESSPASVAPAAFYSDNTLTVRLPESGVLAWATTEQESIGGDMGLDDGNTLRIRVEKDYGAAAGRGDHAAGRDRSAR